MPKLKLIFAGFVVCGLAVALWLQYSSSERLRRENKALRLTVEQLKQTQDSGDAVSMDDSPTKEQWDELLRLRGEVTQLRQQTNQIAALSDANQKLKVSLSEARAPRPSVSKKKINPEDALPQDIHPKDSWAYRGYATPEATVESVCWAMTKGDKAAMLEAFSPDMLPDIEKQMEGKDFAEEMNKINNMEFRILDRQPLSDDEMVLTIYTTRQDANGNNVGNTENSVFQRIGGEWKVTKKPPPDN